MTRNEIEKLFETTVDGTFVNLIIPKDKLGDELNLIGKKQIDLTLEETIRVKQYAAHLYDNLLMK